MTQETDDILAALAHHMAQMERRADAAEREARVTIGCEWQRVLTWLIEDTRERLPTSSEPYFTFYTGKLSALTYLFSLAEEDAPQARVSSAELEQARAQLEDTRASLDDMEKRYERADRQNDEFAAEHELLRHHANEARISAQAANNAMYHAIKREREARAELTTLRTLAHTVCDSAAQQNGALVALVSSAALRALERMARDGD